MQLKSLIILFMIFFQYSAIANLTFDAKIEDAKTKEPKINKTEEIDTKKLTQNKNSLNLSIGKNVEIIDEEKIKSALKRYDVILLNEAKEENKIAIEFNRIVCFVQLARISRIKSGGKIITPEESEYLKKIIESIEKFTKYPNIPAKISAQLFFFHVTSLLDLGQVESARVVFEATANKYSDNKFVPTLSLYLADMYYDEGKLDLAMLGYKKLYSKMSKEEQDLADYKLAWINLNQSRIDEAIEVFLLLIEKSKIPNIVKDSVLSLSVALSEKYDQDTVLDKLSKSNISNENKLLVLWNVYESFLKQPAKDRVKIWENLLSLENKPEDVVRLVSNEIEFVLSEGEVPNEVLILQNIKKYLNTNKDAILKYNQLLLSELGNDLEKIIAKYVSNYQKLNNDINYGKLRISIDMYIKLNSFKRQVEVISLLFELLNQKNDEVPLLNLSEMIIKDLRFSTLYLRAQLIILMDLEKKYLANPKMNQEKFFLSLKKYVEVETNDQWESVAIKNFDYLVKANLIEQAEVLIERIYKLYNKPDYFNKLISIKYEQKKCDEVVNLLKDKNEIEKSLSEYKRECHLIMAQSSKVENKSFSAYQKSILDFISLAEGAKKNAAILDYLLSVEIYVSKSPLSKEEIKSRVDLHKLLTETYYDLRFLPEFFPIYQRYIFKLFDSGEFKSVQHLLKDCETQSVCTSLRPLVKSLSLTSYLDNFKNFDMNSILKENSEIIKYIGLLKPEVYFNFYNDDQLRKVTDTSLLIVSSRLSDVNWNYEKNKILYDLLEKELSRDEKAEVYSVSWNNLEKINFPTAKTRRSFKDQDVVNLMKSVQKTRSVLLNELGNYSFLGQKRLLKKGIEVEAKMYEVIMTSPIPKTLDPLKVDEYKEGLKQLAAEFVNQGNAYKTASNNLDAQNSQKMKIEKTTIGLYNAPDSVDKWRWEFSPHYGPIVKKLVASEEMFTAMFYIDTLLASSKIKVSEYYLLHSGILLISANHRSKNSPMIKYVWNELLLNKQTEVLKSWEGWSKRK